MPRITGVNGVTAHLNGMVGPETITKVGAALFAGGEEIRAEASHMISEGSVSGKHHVPSAPGDPPNRDTGVLQAHIEAAQVGPLRVEVSSNAPYAAVLEFGSSKMLPRPYMQPATDRKRKDVVDLVRAAVSEAIRKR